MLGECAQFCGWDHAEMRFDVRVLAPAAFGRWLAAPGDGARRMSVTGAAARRGAARAPGQGVAGLVAGPTTSRSACG